jgi:hypothetical protein
MGGHAHHKQEGQASPLDDPARFRDINNNNNTCYNSRLELVTLADILWGARYGLG